MSTPLERTTSHVHVAMCDIAVHTSLDLPGLAAQLAAAFVQRQLGPVAQGLILGQLGWESGYFRTLEEYASGEAYEGRADLGNTQPGDGRRFKGRGIVMLTGRLNYERAGIVLGLDLLAQPELLLVPEHAVASAVAYLDKRDLWAVAARGDVLAMTKAINGGTNGYLGRLRLTVTALEALGVEDGEHV